MTVNYIRHEQEFFGVMKLKSGETVLGSMIATEEDSAPGKTVFYIQDPATPHTHQVTARYWSRSAEMVDVC